MTSLPKTSQSKNQRRRMSKYDPGLLQPQLLPRLASIALRIHELIPKRKLETFERASA
ncbi:MAG: hypothetical protein RM347_014920 [Nostoc sp. ChiQUE02]|uniref:hypothetical protein n=1 Tax=Nostoc sp. ChiQUE02 TaxID=3075377 RepID=UPI002AD4B1E2|nr:hypothetical protein [Nostoc sp. ChiQUE02]MDZ8229594.1 hypothetical protein [Nostoc sp. ChiQUE02]